MKATRVEVSPVLSPLPEADNGRSSRYAGSEAQQPAAAAQGKAHYMSAMSELRGGMTDDQKQHALLMRKKLQQDLDQQVNLPYDNFNPDSKRM